MFGQRHQKNCHQTLCVYYMYQSQKPRVCYTCPKMDYVKIKLVLVAKAYGLLYYHTLKKMSEFKGLQ